MAKAAYLGMVTVHVKPGRTLDAEKQITKIREAAMNKQGIRPAGVTEVMFGGSPGTFYVTIPLESLGQIATMGNARSILGEDGYQAYSQMTAENYASLDYKLLRAVPMWSNPPSAYLDSNPKLWKVKPASTPKIKAPQA